MFHLLTGILKPQSNGSLYSNAVIGTLAVGGWAVNIWYSEERPGRAAVPPSPSSLYQTKRGHNRRSQSDTAIAIVAAASIGDVAID